MSVGQSCPLRSPVRAEELAAFGGPLCANLVGEGIFFCESVGLHTPSQHTALSGKAAELGCCPGAGQVRVFGGPGVGREVG